MPYVSSRSLSSTDWRLDLSSHGRLFHLYDCTKTGPRWWLLCHDSHEIVRERCRNAWEWVCRVGLKRRDLISILVISPILWLMDVFLDLIHCVTCDENSSWCVYLFILGQQRQWLASYCRVLENLCTMVRYNWYPSSHLLRSSMTLMWDNIGKRLALFLYCCSSYNA